MRILALEIRDRMTFVPVVAFSTDWNNERQRYLLARGGFKGVLDAVFVTKLTSDETHSDPHAWNDRTMLSAHKVICANWGKLSDGDVIDVEFELGETDAPKFSEFFDSESVVYGASRPEAWVFEPFVSGKFHLFAVGGPLSVERDARRWQWDGSKRPARWVEHAPAQTR